ncbi:MAG: hypothetical protein K6F25_04940 [Bacteroidales bacterium]|nr:hypothetical protein [Bacteroidales bacterium]
MNDQNKSIIKEGLVKIALVLYALITIITFAGVWNFCEEGFVCLMAGVLFACNGLAIVRLWKKSETKPSE